MIDLPKRRDDDRTYPASEGADNLSRALESTPDVVAYSIGFNPDPFRVGEIHVTVTFRTGRGRNAQFWVTIPASAAIDIPKAELICFFAEYMRRFVRKHDERIAKALRVLPCGHYDATDNELREKLPCAQCVSWPELEMLNSGGMPVSWLDDIRAATDSRPIPTIHFRRERFILPSGDPVTRWKREESELDDEDDEESE